jgi:hypothetical protein
MRSWGFLGEIGPTKYWWHSKRLTTRSSIRSRPTTLNPGDLLHPVEEEARGPSASQLRHFQIMKHLRLPNWDGHELPLWPPHRSPDPTVFVPVLGGDPRLSEALKNYSGPW